MYKGKSIAALVPAYNEEKLITSVIDGMPDFVDYIIIVDVCSKDKTSEKIKAYLQKEKVSKRKNQGTILTKQDDRENSRVVLMRHEVNTGLGGAINTAVTKAKELNTDIGVVMAGDNQMDPNYLPSLLDPICEDKYDFTKANRFYAAEGFLNMPKHRVFGSIVLAFMTRVASGYWKIIDPQNGYVAYGPRVLKEVDFNKITRGYALENDILINMNILNMKIKEVPIPAVYGEETSTMKLWKIIPSFSLFLFFGFFRRIFKKYFLRGIHPVFLFFTSGSIFFLWGLIFGLATWQRSFETQIPATTGTVMLSVVPFLIGFEMLMWGLVLDIQEEPK